MKKILITLILALTLSLTACGSTEPTNTNEAIIETETQETEISTNETIGSTTEAETPELEETINDTDSQYQDGYEGELNVESEESTEQEKPNSNLNLSAEDRQWYKDNLSLTDEELNTITEAELNKLFDDWLSGKISSGSGSSGTSGGSGSSGNSGGSSGNDGSSTGDNNSDTGRPDFGGNVREEDVLPGHM